MSAMDNASFYRQQFANQNLLNQQRQNALTDEMRQSEIGRLNNAIGAIQAHPTMSPDEKAAKIQQARSQIMQLYTPSLGKKRVAELQSQFGLSPDQMAGNAPQEAPIQLGNQPIQAATPQEQSAPGMDIPTGSMMPPIDLPGRGEVAVKPADEVSQLLAQTPNMQYLPVTLSNGTTMMLPAAMAGHLISTQEANAGKMGVAQLKTESNESVQNANRESREVIADKRLHGMVRETFIPDSQSSTGFSKVSYDPISGAEHSRQKDVLPPRGFISTHTESTDQFGNKVITERSPLVPQGQPQGQPQVPSQATIPSPQAGGVGAPPAPPPVQPPKPKAVAKPAVQQPKVSSPEPLNLGLDDNGHIRMLPGMNGQVVQFANRLLDGADIKDIPMKAQAPAQELAGRYGWKGQGFLTPKDQMMVRQSENLLRTFSQSPSLAVLDNAVSRNKIAQVLQNPEKRGAIGGFIQERAAANLTPAEQEFVTLYNQAVGRIAGLSQLVRPGSRTTEAQIERLKSELPNPLTTTSSAHAREKFAMIQNEIDTAKQKGQFSDAAPAPVSASQHKVGDTVTLRNGQQVVIKEILPDGKFTY